MSGTGAIFLCVGIGSKLRELRKSKGLSQAELGRKIGLSQKAVTCYERETREPSLDTLNALAKALEVPLVELLGEGRKPDVVAKPARTARNKRTLKVQALFEKLSPAEQRVVLKQIEGLISK